MEDPRGCQQEGDAVLGVLGRPEEGLTRVEIPGVPSATRTPGVQGKSVYKCSYARLYSSAERAQSLRFAIAERQPNFFALCRQAALKAGELRR